LNDENGSTVISGRKIGSATRWALMGEIAAKLAAPLTNMILARLLLPEIFGIVAAISYALSGHISLYHAQIIIDPKMGHRD